MHHNFNDVKTLCNAAVKLHFRK